MAPTLRDASKNYFKITDFENGHLVPYEGVYTTGTTSSGSSFDMNASIKVMEEYMSTNYKSKPKKMSIKRRIKKMLLGEPEKTLVKAELMDIDGNWEYDARQYAKEKMLEEYMSTQEFKDSMVELAQSELDNKKD